ncbi:MAG: hypothetical protein QOK05_1427 [Chloroflexota bacterium]|jgi:hypothetical protein|nr:hypothetical protein [Chloroflexota bacterium]
MLVRYYLEIPCPATAVKAVLSLQPRAWLPAIVGDSNHRGLEVLSKVGVNLGPRRIDREVALTVSDGRQQGATWTIPIAWRPVAERSMLPSLEGQLEVCSLADDRAQLAISATYRPPLGWVGAVSDRALMRRVAEATIKDFLDRVAVRVQAGIEADPDDHSRRDAPAA